MNFLLKKFTECPSDLNVLSTAEKYAYIDIDNKQSTTLFPIQDAITTY